MVRAKNINLYLMDGDATGRIKCTLANWTGLAYKIPRSLLNESKTIDYLKQTGVYLLFGEEEETGDPLVYVGQAGIRKNGKGIICRLDEHVLNEKKDWWNIAVAFTTSNNSFGPTEISYLENRFYRMALEAKRYKAQNGNEPNPGNLTEEKESELEEYVDYAKLVIGALGFKVFDSLRSTENQETIENKKPEEPILYCTRAQANAIGQRTREGFVVFKGSKIRASVTPSCPQAIKKQRELYAHEIDPLTHTLRSDLLFTSSSGAASFVSGSSSNGNVEWKTETGVLLGDLEKENQRN